MGRNTEPYNSNIHDNLLIDLRIMVKGNLARMYCLYERSNSNSFLLNLMTTDSMMVRYYVSTIRNGISLLKNNRFFLARKHKRNFFVPLAPVKNSFFCFSEASFLYSCHGCRPRHVSCNLGFLTDFPK